MSVVTNIILTFSCLEDEKERLREINTFFPDISGLTSCDDDKLPRGWYGGTKMLETNICIGAFNHLDFERFLEHMKTIKWRYPEYAQIIVQEQEDDRFRFIELHS